MPLPFGSASSFCVLTHASARAVGAKHVPWGHVPEQQGVGEAPVAQLDTTRSTRNESPPQVFIERYVVRPRHIEIQLLADGHGNCIYLPERECSIQRRNQKVVEEAPAAHLSAAAVRRMGEEAVALAKAVSYRSAGTVEFLVDDKEQHYFLEMNTRLQVEHPVTEMVSGIDLVEAMLRVASGERLWISQREVVASGWAIESRVYAEDPLRRFLPSIGTLSRYAPPGQAATVSTAATNADVDDATEYGGLVRLDDGVSEGSEITLHYDPMLSKLITYGKDREHARQLMVAALDRYVVRGVRHNQNFLRSLMVNERFARGELTTSFIADEYPDGYHGHVLSSSQRRDMLAAVGALQLVARAQVHSISDADTAG
eukprot:CAMPEP_0119364330 /NCGR_PEP_ID=MMETSP1334-20130426/11243_1 /TAXON_ID=127549 /ORGANISM="Calcidiscus leptoporus, Strain RCC1130" /LENGTH=370 /DNA_ID=CAMNT_0007379995 /DNA_START=147 /DNA_END=1257 /DNA_ORIENTATION=+